MSYQITYNKESYEVSIEVARFDVKKPDEIVESSRYMLVQDFLSKMTLMNDLSEHYPYLEIEYTDTGHNLWNKYTDDGYTSLLFRMRLYREDEQDGPELTHSFIVSSISLINSTTQSATYRIKCTSLLFNMLGSNVEYSTGGKSKSPTQIAREILKRVKYPITFRPEDVNAPKEKNMPYISPANFNVLQNVRYLLERSVSPHAGIFRLIYDMPSREGRIICLNEIFKKFPTNVDNRNIFDVPMKYTGPISHMNIVDIRTENLLGAMIYGLLGNTTLNNFDYMNRRWTKDIYDYARYMNIMPALDKKEYPEFRMVCKPNPSAITMGNKYAREETNVSYDAICSKMDTIYRFGNVIMFNQWGYIGRDAGQMMALKAEDVLANTKFAGGWLITRIYHTFTRETYENNITAVRTMEKNTDDMFSMTGIDDMKPM